MRIIGRAQLIRVYENIVSYGSVNGAKIPSLDEFLSVTSGEEEVAAFDAKTDAALEAMALRKFEEAKQKHGGQ